MWAALAVLLCACEQSVVPIDTVAGAPFDSSLVGTWRQIDSVQTPGDNAAMTVLSVLEYRAPEYFIEVDDSAGISPLDHDPRLRARAFITRVGGASFMNVEDLTSSPRSFTLYRYTMRSDTLSVRALTKAAHRFTTSADLRRFIITNMEADSLYEDSVRFTRVLQQHKSAGIFP